jgi:ATP-binding cassette subfamily B protein
MGIVTQVPFLFDGTVEENIRFAAPNIIGGITQLANQIGNGEWLETFSNGLDTQVGERGAPTPWAAAVSGTDARFWRITRHFYP